MPTRVPALVILLLALGTAGLTGCGSDSDASADPPAPAPTSTTPTVDPTPTTAPTQAPPGETAREFIERWFRISRYSQNSGDTQPLRDSALDCRACERLAHTIDSYYDKGGSITTDGATVMSIKIVPSTEGTTVLHVRARVAPTRIVTEEGGTVKRLSGGDATYEFVLRREEGWKVTDLFDLV